MRRFLLDEQFPGTVLPQLARLLAEVELVPLRAADPALCGLSDSELLLEAYRMGGWDGFLSLDAAILDDPFNLVILHRTKLTLVVVEASGHDPARGAGLLLVHLPAICKKCTSSAGQIWKLAAANKNHEKPLDLLKLIAQHRSRRWQDLLAENQPTAADLRRHDASQRRLVVPRPKR